MIYVNCCPLTLRVLLKLGLGLVTVPTTRSCTHMHTKEGKGSWPNLVDEVPNNHFSSYFTQLFKISKSGGRSYRTFNQSHCGSLIVLHVMDAE